MEVRVYDFLNDPDRRYEAVQLREDIGLTTLNVGSQKIITAKKADKIKSKRKAQKRARRKRK